MLERQVTVGKCLISDELFKQCSKIRKILVTHLHIANTEPLQLWKSVTIRYNVANLKVSNQWQSQTERISEMKRPGFCHQLGTS